ncbi:MAG: O-antigen ligase family protein [Gammaproteobacteria bacterium]|nr:O-antigen ligase family protein [Gammaproteobacteria bacterium]
MIADARVADVGGSPLPDGPALVAYFAAALLPLGLIFSKSLAEAAVVIIGVCFILHAVRGPRENLLNAEIGILIGVWFILVVFVSFAALDVSASLGRAIPWFRFILLYAAWSLWLVRFPSCLRRLFCWYALLLMAIVVDMVIQQLTGESLTGNPLLWTRVTGPMERPGVGALLGKIGMPTVAGLIWLATSQRTANRRLLYAAGGLALVLLTGVLISGDRNESLLTTAAFVLVAYGMARSSRRGRYLAATTGIGLMVVIAAIFGLNEFSRIRVRYLVEQLLNFTATEYFRIFESAFRVFMDNPWTGAGLKGYRVACNRLLERGEVMFCGLHPHNIYLEWLSETGLLASAAFLLFIGLTLREPARLWRVGGTGRIIAAILLGSLMISLFPIAASRSFFSNWPAILLWTSLGMCIGIARQALACRTRR